eukprot:jgi/Bigna1/137459/aug1.39_g12167
MDNSENFRTIFNQLDEDQDGLVSIEEVTRWLPNEDMQRQIKELWEGKTSNGVNLREFKEICNHLMEARCNEEMDTMAKLEEEEEAKYNVVRELFDKLDVERKGYITMNQLAPLMTGGTEEDLQNIREKISPSDTGKIVFEDFYEGFDFFISSSKVSESTLNDWQQNEKPFVAPPPMPTVPRNRKMSINSQNVSFPADTPRALDARSDAGGTTLKYSETPRSTFRDPMLEALRGRGSMKFHNGIPLTETESGIQPINSTGLTPVSGVDKKYVFSREQDRLDMHKLQEKGEGDSVGSKHTLRREGDEGREKTSAEALDAVSFFHEDLGNNVSAAFDSRQPSRRNSMSSGADELGHLRTKFETALEHIKTMERKYAVLTRFGKRLEIENTNLEARLTNSVADCSALEDEVQEWQSKVDELEQRNMSVTEHVRTLTMKNFDLNKVHLETIESLELEQRHNEALSKKLNEQENRLKELNTTSRERRSAFMNKLAKSSELMDGMKLKRKARELQEQLDSEEKKNKVATRKLFGQLSTMLPFHLLLISSYSDVEAALEVKAKEKIIASLNEKLNMRDATEGRPLAWDMPVEGILRTAKKYSTTNFSETNSQTQEGTKSEGKHRRWNSSESQQIASYMARTHAAKKLLSTIRKGKVGCGQLACNSVGGLDRLKDFYSNKEKTEELKNMMRKPPTAPKIEKKHSADESKDYHEHIQHVIDNVPKIALSTLPKCQALTEELLRLLRKRMGITSRKPLPTPLVVNQTPKSSSASERPLPRPKTSLSQGLQMHVTALAIYLNAALSDAAETTMLKNANLLPLNTEGDDLIQKLSDGLILAAFINHAIPGTIDTRALNTSHWHDPDHNPFNQRGFFGSRASPANSERKILTITSMQENLTLVFESAKSIGVQAPEVRVRNILHAHRSPQLAIRFLWGILVTRVESAGNARRNPDLARVLLEEKGDDVKAATEAACEMGPRNMILNWVFVSLSYLNYPTIHMAIFRYVSKLKWGYYYVQILNILRESKIVAPKLEKLSAMMTKTDWRTYLLTLIGIQYSMKLEAVSRAHTKQGDEDYVLRDNDHYRAIKDKLKDLSCKEPAIFIGLENELEELKGDTWKPPFCTFGLIMMSKPGLFAPETIGKPSSSHTRTPSSMIRIGRSKGYIMSKDEDRLERAFRMWINSIGLKGVYIQNLFRDCRNGRNKAYCFLHFIHGIVLLKTLDKVVPGSVGWVRVERRPTNKFKKISNCNLLIELGKSAPFNFSLVNIDGRNIEEGHKKLTLALVWQMMRHHLEESRALKTQYLKLTSIAVNLKADPSCLLKQKMKRMLSNGGDSVIVEWANSTIEKALKKRNRLPEINGKVKIGINLRHVSKIRTFKDLHLRKSFYFLMLLWAVDQQVIDWDLVTVGDNEEQCKLNARYSISVSRKLGATVFLLPEDITEVNAKMIMTFISAILALGG